MTLVRSTALVALLALLLAQWPHASVAQIASAGTPGFTKAQSAAGRKAYREHCAICHGARLEGKDISPSLTGSRFDQAWRGKSADVLSFHLRRMPPEGIAQAGSLNEEAYTNILAYVLHSNDFQPGKSELPSEMAALGDVDIPQLAGMEYDPVVPVEKSEEQTALLNALDPVTDELLRNPSANDWMHWGRTYDGHSYSPLATINRQNVKDLTVAWRAPLRFGSSMPMPLVYQGVMFLHTFPDTVLALDATNGAVLWRVPAKRSVWVDEKDGPGSLSRQGLCLHHRLTRRRPEHEDRRAGLGPRDRHAILGAGS